MAVTRISAEKRIADGSIVSAKIADSAIVEAKIADKAVTPAKLDDTLDYSVNKLVAHSEVALESTLSVTGKVTAQDELEVQKATSLKDTMSVDGDATFGSNVVIAGNLQVDGDQVIANTSTMEVEDKNFVINKGGNSDSMTGSGFTVDNTDGTNGSLVYDSTLVSKWKAGEEGSETEVVVLSGEQTLTDKTYKLVGDVIEDEDNVEDALRALDDKVNNSTAYTVQEGDLNSANFNADENRWEVGEGIKDASYVHIYVSGVKLRSGEKDEDGNISNDFAVDYANGYIEYNETLFVGANLIVEYIPA